MTKFQPVSVPNGPREEKLVWDRLSGGLNLQELDYRMAHDQSPELENLWWQDGLLSCRDGQTYVNQEMPGTGLCAYEKTFHGYAVFHLGDGIWAGIPGETMELRQILGDLPQIRGSFFLYGGCLYYKTAGSCCRIGWADGLTAESVEIQTEGESPVMECTLTAVYGGMAVYAGAPSMPDACFCSAVGDPLSVPAAGVSMGRQGEAITGFGLQAGYLMVLQTGSVGRCRLENGVLQYTTVNPTMGCDLPHTVKTVENNLVWCGKNGVYLLKSTTAAMENNVVCLSGKVHGGNRPGLLQALSQAETVCAVEDGRRYWVAADGQVWLWDHSLSDWDRPCWFYFSGIGAVDFFRDGSALYHVDKHGRITRFVRDYTDYGGGIRKVYRFAVSDLGGCDRRKTVRRLVVTTRSDTDTLIRLTYETDRQQRTDLTPIRSLSWRLCPRNLAFRALRSQRFAHVAVRRPNCRHVQYFGLRLENDEPGADMSIVSAEVYYTRDRREK